MLCFPLVVYQPAAPLSTGKCDFLPEERKIIPGQKSVAFRREIAYNKPKETRARPGEKGGALV